MNAWKNWIYEALNGGGFRAPVQARAGLAPEWQAIDMGDRTIYSGYFTVFGRGGELIYSLPGRIVEWRAFPTDVYIFRPPEDLRSLPKGPCLQLASPGGDWFKLHWATPARSFEASRAYVEEMLSQIPSQRLLQLSALGS